MSYLDGQLSPYLQAHADNPIDWYPWGPEAFEEATRRDVPVLISIGYHTCHWCHVMARESFQDENIAQRVNEAMVAIKVDREEHPDVDAHYLTQAGAFLEQLGWPLTIFATPQGDAFHAATYLPPTPRGDVPSFGQIIDAVTQAWRETRDQVDQGAQRLREAIRAADAQAKQRDAFDLNDSVWEGIISHLLEHEDTQWGGLGGAPKFPIAPVVSFLLGTNRPDATALARRTLTAIAGSSLRDSVDGGFFRYATKPDWSEPHYERMLSDNAQLLRLYSDIFQLETAAGIVNWLRTVMRLPIGFGSAQDSESVVDGERVEGGYYRADPAVRSGLVPPAIDDKVLAGWNGLAIAGLARAGRHGVAGDPLGLAQDVAVELWETHWSDDAGLARMSRDGSLSSAHATLEDYGGLAVGFIELGLATGDPLWCSRAKQLVDVCIDPEGFFRAPGGMDPTVASFEAISGDVTEGAMPSGVALVAQASLSLHQLTGEDGYYTVAQTSVDPYAEAVSVRPLGFGGLAGVLWQTHRGLRELVVVGPAGNSVAKWARDHLPPSWLLLCVTPDQARSWSQADFGLLDSRDAGEGVVAYVCRGGVCDLPRGTIAEVEKAIQSDPDA